MVTKTIKSAIIILALILNFNSGYSQEIKRETLRLPKEINGLKVLKCDFHIHTIFSDGSVWPTQRVAEAVAEGLDVISITDHIEYRPHLDKTIGKSDMSYNSAYENALTEAAAMGITLIPGVEITKDVPPGHFNALFINDADKFANFIGEKNPRDGSLIRESLKEARRQGAFIHWNHPWYKVEGNKSIWTPIIDSLYNEGFIDGIEVINATKYDPVILGWVQDKNLTNIGNTDVHTPMYLKDGKFRTMTIVFAKDNSPASIKEALFNKQTLSYCNNYLYGDEKFLKDIFANSIELNTSSDGKNGLLTLINHSSIEYKIELLETDGLTFRTYTGGLTLPSLGDTAVKVSDPKGIIEGKVYKIKIAIENLHSAPDKALETYLDIIF